MNPMGNYRSLRPTKKNILRVSPTTGGEYPTQRVSRPPVGWTSAFLGICWWLETSRCFLAVFLDFQKDTVFQHPEMAKIPVACAPSYERESRYFWPVGKGCFSGCVPFRCVETTLRFWGSFMGKHKTKKATPGGVPKVCWPKIPWDGFLLEVKLLHDFGDHTLRYY